MVMSRMRRRRSRGRGGGGDERHICPLLFRA